MIASLKLAILGFAVLNVSEKYHRIYSTVIGRIIKSAIPNKILSGESMVMDRLRLGDAMRVSPGIPPRSTDRRIASHPGPSTGLQIRG